MTKQELRTEARIQRLVVALEAAAEGAYEAMNLPTGYRFKTNKAYDEFIADWIAPVFNGQRVSIDCICGQMMLEEFARACAPKSSLKDRMPWARMLAANKVAA